MVDDSQSIVEKNLDALLRQAYDGHEINKNSILAPALSDIANTEAARIDKINSGRKNSREDRTDAQIAAEKQHDINAKLAEEVGPNGNLRASLLSASQGDVTGAISEFAKVSDLIKSATSIPELLASGNIGGVIAAVGSAIENSKSMIAINSLGDFNKEIHAGKIHSFGDIIDFFKEKIFQGKEKEALGKVSGAAGINADDLYKALHAGETNASTPSSDTPTVPASGATTEKPPSVTTSSQPFGFRHVDVPDAHGMNLKPSTLPPQPSLTTILTTKTHR